MRIKNKRWSKVRHKVIFATLRPIFKLHLRLKYNYHWGKCEKQLPKGGCIVLSNHQTTLDAFMMAASFKRPIYFMMNDDIYTLGFISKVIKFLVAPIPKSKSKADINAVKITLKVLREGKTVGIFPEGNRTLCGKNWEMDDSAARLVKMAKVPVALYKIVGGYGADPRWGKGIRRGKVTSGIVKVLSPSEIEKLSVEELDGIIRDSLKSQDLEGAQKFKNKNRAQFLERALYYCPKCGSLNSLRSEGSKIACKQCDFSAEYTEDLKFKEINGKLFGETTAEWFEVQKQKLKEIFSNSPNDLKLFEDLVEIRLISGRKRDKRGEATVLATKEKMVVFGNKIEKELNFSKVLGATVLGKRKINFYLEDGTTFQIKGSERFSAIKYLHLYEIALGGN